MKSLSRILGFTWIGLFFGSGASAITADFTFVPGCLGSPVTFTSTTTPPDSILALLWDLNADGFFDDASGESVTWTFLSTGIYQVGLQAIALNGDVNAVYKDVTVAGVQASFVYTAGCMGEPVSFSDSSIAFADSIVHRTWNFGDGSFMAGVKNPTHIYTETGIFDVSLLLTTHLGCGDTLTLPVPILPPPELTLLFSGDTSTFYRDTILVEATGTFDSVRWNGIVPGSIYSISAPGTVSVTAWLNNCFTTTSFRIQDHPGVKTNIMTLFTPNGDGYNDLWVIRNLDTLGPCSVRVFDGWGSLVYENPHYQNTWDGKSDNRELPSGPYYYVIILANGNLFKGTVNILR